MFALEKPLPEPPPIVELEGIKATDLAKGWASAPVKPFPREDSSSYSRMEAVLNPESISTAIYAVMYSSTHGQIEPMLSTMAASNLELMDFFQLFGIPARADLKKDMDAKLRAQATLLSATFGEFVELIERRDRISGEIRISLASFRYTDKNGKTGYGMYGLRTLLRHLEVAGYDVPVA